MKAELTRVLPRAEMRLAQHEGPAQLYQACMSLSYCQDTSRTRQPSFEDPSGLLAGMT